MPADQGFDFRDTPSFVVDPANCTYVLATDGPGTVRDGKSFGFTVGSNTPAGNDIDVAEDPRMAGDCVVTSGQTLEFGIDLDGPGTYDADAALNGVNSAGAICVVKDDTSTLFSISFAGHVTDAMGNLLTDLTWPTSKALMTGLVFTTSTCILHMGSFGGNNAISHFRLTSAGGGGGGGSAIPLIYHLTAMGA